jgi:hypothetical protein
MRILTTTPILTGEITINEFLGCEWIREAREISRRWKNKNTKDNGDEQHRRFNCYLSLIRLHCRLSKKAPD